MLRRAPRGDADPLSRFRSLTTATILAVFVLIVHGGVVRVSEAGLGCGPAGSGTHGWPLCEGGLIPPGSAEALIEFSHRIAAGIVAVMIALLAWRALRTLRERPWLVRGALAAVGLVLIQATLGGLTVEQGLQDELVAAHLGLAMLLIGILILLRRGADPEAPPPAARGGRSLGVLAVVASTLLLGTLVSGGYVAGTERMGTPEAPVAGAHMACGQQFPRCLGKFMPFGTSRLVDIHLTHRLFMYLASLAILATVAVALVQGGRSRAFPLAAALLAGQVLLGASNVWFDMHAGLIIGHLALGTLLWVTVVQAAATLLPAPQPRAARAPAPHPAPETAAA
jgi:heme a synthase